MNKQQLIDRISNTMTQPIIKQVLMDFEKWVRDNDYSLYTPNIAQWFLDQYQLPNFMDNPTLNDLWQDADNEYDLGIRTGIRASWQEVFGDNSNSELLNPSALLWVG